MEWLVSFIIVMIMCLITCLVKAMCASAVRRIYAKEKSTAADEEKRSYLLDK